METVTFSLPLSSECRLDLSFTCLLAFTFFQNVVASELPKSADNPPLLLIYIAAMSFYIVMAISFQSLTLYMANCGKRHRKLPFMLQSIFKSKIIKKDTAGCNPWLDCATILDRYFAAIIFSLVVSTPIISFIIIPIIIQLM